MSTAYFFEPPYIYTSPTSVGIALSLLSSVFIRYFIPWGVPIVSAPYSVNIYLLNVFSLLISTGTYLIL